MILDQTSIKELLVTKAEDFDAKREEQADVIYIRTDNETNMFVEDQIGNDSIDLSIADSGYVMKNDYTFLNTLKEGEMTDYFREVSIPSTGYMLKPGDLLFVPTFERIALSGNLIGRVTGRSVFARMGLSVHCTQDKFSSGINSVAGLQIKNNSPISLLIFPRQRLAQILIERTEKNRHPYDGIFREEGKYTLPVVQDKDRAHYDSRSLELIKKRIPQKRPLGKQGKTGLTIALCKTVFPAIAAISMGCFGLFKNTTGLIVSGIAEIIGLVFLSVIEYIYQGENNERQR